MSRKYKVQFADPAGVVIGDQGGYGRGLFAAGTTVPTDGTAGYLPGCVFLDTDGTTVSTVYRNEGSSTSCSFKRMLSVTDVGGIDLSTLLATATELNRAADMSTRIVNCTASTLAVTEASHDGKVITLNRAAGIAVTLPTPVAGMWFRFVVQTTFTGAASIKSVSGSHIMIGHAIMGNDSDNTTVMWQALAASTYDTINLFGTANSTGGIAGQTIDIKALSSTVWLVEMQGDAAGTEATPFADTVA